MLITVPTFEVDSLHIPSPANGSNSGRDYQKNKKRLMQLGKKKNRVIIYTYEIFKLLGWQIIDT